MLTQQLLPLLSRSAPARIVIIASRAHRRARLNLAALPRGGDCGAFAAYARSKLCNMLFMRALVPRLAQSGVTVNAVHPGVVNTQLFASLPLARSAAALLGRAFLLSPESGARCGLYVATAAQLAAVSGEYFESCAPVAPSPAARDARAAEELWQLCERLAAL